MSLMSPCLGLTPQKGLSDQSPVIISTKEHASPSPGSVIQAPRTGLGRSWRLQLRTDLWEPEKPHSLSEHPWESFLCVASSFSQQDTKQAGGAPHRAIWELDSVARRPELCAPGIPSYCRR